MEPLTLAAVGTMALTEGIKFLYAQAGELIRWRRERRKEQPAVVAEAEDALEGRLAQPEVDVDAFDRLAPDIKALAGRLGNYANGLDEVVENDEDVVAAADALRTALEAVLGQRITFKGEPREASGTVVKGRVDVGEVEGYVAAVRARVIKGGTTEGTVKADRVGEKGEAVAVDVGEIE
jgi:hypothetical protein